MDTSPAKGSSNWRAWTSQRARASSGSPAAPAPSDEFGVHLEWPSSAEHPANEEAAGATPRPPARARKERPVADAAAPGDAEPLLPRLVAKVAAMQASVDEATARIERIAGAAARDRAAAQVALDEVTSRLEALSAAVSQQPAAVADAVRAALADAALASSAALQQVDARIAALAGRVDELLARPAPAPVAPAVDALGVELAELRSEVALLRKRIPVRARDSGAEQLAAQVAQAVMSELRSTFEIEVLEGGSVFEPDPPQATGTARRRPLRPPGSR